MYVAALFELEHAMRRVPLDLWEEASPCDRWTARDVAGHAIAVIEHIPARLGRGVARDPFVDLGLVAGPDPVTSLRTVRAAAMVALDTKHALATTVETSMGTMTVDDYLVPLGRDAVVHAWDIARATGTDESLDPILVDFTLVQLDPTQMAAGRGTYAAAVELPPGSTALHRLLAAVGRAPPLNFPGLACVEPLAQDAHRAATARVDGSRPSVRMGVRRCGRSAAV
jgi:uncharacterized protein (TIGR03086 family)